MTTDGKTSRRRRPARKNTRKAFNQERKPTTDTNTNETGGNENPQPQTTVTPTDAELLADGLREPEFPKWRELHADLVERYAPVGAAETQLVAQAATVILRRERHLQRILSALEALQRRRRANSDDVLDWTVGDLLNAC
jgi:hypothetical protein